MRVIQELLVPVDTQLEREAHANKLPGHRRQAPPVPPPPPPHVLRPLTCVLTCCSGAVTRLAQLSHSMTMMDRKRQAARIHRGRPERLRRRGGGGGGLGWSLRRPHAPRQPHPPHLDMQPRKSCSAAASSTCWTACLPFPPALPAALSP